MGFHSGPNGNVSLTNGTTKNLKIVPLNKHHNGNFSNAEVKQTVSRKRRRRKKRHNGDGFHPSIIINSSGQPSKSLQQYRKQTWVQSFLLLSAIFITLPRLIYRVTKIHCPKQTEKQSIERSLLENICRFASMVIDNHAHYIPYHQHFLGIQEFESDEENITLDKRTSKASSALESVSRMNTTAMRGIFHRFMKRHRFNQQKLDNRLATVPDKALVVPMDRKHILRHLLERASLFSHLKKSKRQSQTDKLHHQYYRHDSFHQNIDTAIDWKKWKYAMSDDFDLNPDQIALVKELSKRVFQKAKSMTMSTPDDDTADINTMDDNVSAKVSLTLDNISKHTMTSITTSLSGGTNVSKKPFLERVDDVPWGGVYNQDYTRWWPKREATMANNMNCPNNNKISSQSEGGRLLASYLTIMKWPKNLHAEFPFKLCAQGCDSEVAILHTLEWREKYLPWCITPKITSYNKDGFIYHRGHSHAGPQLRLKTQCTHDATYLKNAGHTMIWYRPSRAALNYPELFERAVIYTLESAVADSLIRNKGELGRYNVVLDCEGVGSKSFPSLSQLQKFFTLLQDHFPDRLGVLLLVNLSGMTKMIMNMLLTFVSQDVRAKIHIIPSGEEERKNMLIQFMDEVHVPLWLGGKDDFVFQSDEYYFGSVGESNKCILSEDEIKKYLVTMPYHA